jgi:hypothetical protein
MELSRRTSVAPTTPAATLPRRQAAWDAIRAVLVVLLAFLLASSPARNSDLWLHLAAGRALLQGDYRPSTDPFAHTTEGAYWVNHSWLYDVLAYGLYQTAGGVGLVVVKALLVAGLAALMLCCCWRTGEKWLAALAVAAGVVALGPYLPLRPAVVSYVLLGVTLWWLQQAWAGPRRGLGFSIILPALFALWANLDEWFLLGPLTVGLYALGAVLEDRRDAARGRARPDAAERLRALGLVAAAGLATVLLNPHHVRALTLPAALGPPGTAWPPEDVPGIDPLSSPFAAASLRSTFVTPAGIA